MDFKFGLLVMLCMVSASSCDQLCSDEVIGELINRLDSQQQQINSQRTEIDNQKSEIQMLKEKLALKEKKENKLSSENQSTKSFNVRQLPIEGTIAFTAVLNHEVTKLGVNQNIVFDLVHTNVGNAYNPHHGTFVAPVTGVYVFHTTIFTRLNHLAWCKIMVNGVQKVSVYVQAPAGLNNSGSQMLVVRLNKGDDVAVQNIAAADYIYSDGNNYNSFSGFLLQDLSEIDSTNVVG
ncbi:positive regulation of adiponectin secretion [Mactra antiquata]